MSTALSCGAGKEGCRAPAKLQAGRFLKGSLHMKKEEKTAHLPSWGFIISKAGLAVMITAATLLLVWCCRKSSLFASEQVRPFAERTLGVLSRAFAFTGTSVAELLLYALVVGVLISIVWVMIVCIRGPYRLRRFLSWLSALALLASMMFLMFEGLYGCSYAAESKLDALDLQVKERSHEELAALCGWLAKEAEGTRAAAGFQEATPSAETFADDAEAVARIVSAYTGTGQLPPKRVWLSRYMSYTNLTGVFCPFTGEANVNANDMDIAVPFTMAHEIMHRWGVTAEDEANCFAFISLYESGEARYRYTAAYMGLLYTLPKLRKADKALYQEQVDLMSDALKNDINAYYAHWKQYEGKTAEVASKVNNTYLVLQGENDGVESYGKVVDWLLAYHASL